MKIILSSRRRHYMRRVGIFLIAVALIAGMTGCVGVKYDLTIASTAGGSVTTPGEGTGSFTYAEGRVVNLVAEAEEGYHFVNWTGDISTIGSINQASTTITMEGNYEIKANFEAGPYSLTISSTTGGSATTPGEGTFEYDAGTVVNLVAEAEEGYQFANWTGDVNTVVDVNAASTTIIMNNDYTISASFAKAIRTWYDLDTIRNNLDGSYILMNNLDSTSAGYEELASPTANGGKGWEPIGNLLADPIDQDIVDPVYSFTGSLDGQGYEIRDLFINRPDEDGVGLSGSVAEGVIENLGVVNAEVTGDVYVGGLAGGNSGTVRNSYSSGSVTGAVAVGGLAGGNWGTVSNSYSTGSVTGNGLIGGLVGENLVGTVSNSYSSGSVTGEGGVGGLVGCHHGTVNNSHYNYDEVLINGTSIITIGALFGEDFEQWLANDKFLGVNERLSQEDGYYLIKDVNDFKSLLAFGQDGALKFRLKNDLDLGDEPNFYIPYLAGEFNGNGRKIANLSFSFDFISQVGLFGYLASGGAVTGVSAENVNITGNTLIGGLVGENDGTVSNSYSTGRVAGNSYVGGLVGWIGYSGGTVSNSYYSYDEVLINGKNIITIGALFNEDFDQWLANDKFLDVNERLSQEDGHYLINDVSDFKQLLAFGQGDSLKFRLKNDLNLETEANFYIPYLTGEFDGNGHKIWNLSLHFDSVAQVGLFGYLGSDGKVSEVGVENVNVTGDQDVGGLVGGSVGTVSNSYSTGSVTGNQDVGGLVGWNGGTVRNSYSSGSVIGRWGVGGLVGWNYGGTVSNSYSTGSAPSDWRVGGLVGANQGRVSNSFWDTETSGQSTSDGGTGKTTAEMKKIDTFSGAGWNIVAVANPSTRNTTYIWNIVDNVTYPFLSWQALS
ncbi:MAG: GLUG motif-containing protein [Dehalococcoidia bacterium]